jgi:hypothetical protein
MIQAVQVFAEQLDDLEAELLVLMQPIKKVLTLNMGHTSSRRNRGGKPVLASTHGLRQPQDRSSAHGFQDLRSLVLGREQQTYPALLHHIDSTANISSTKECVLAGIHCTWPQSLQCLPKVNVP